MSDEEAFKQSVECITGPLTRIISRDGMIGVYNQFNDADKKIFEEAYAATPPPSHGHLLRDLRGRGLRKRNQVGRCGRSRGSTSSRWGRLTRPTCGRSERRFAAKRVESEIPINPFTAGVYIAVMMATVQTLSDKGHPYSEDLQ